jgi:hypothetical protein
VQDRRRYRVFTKLGKTVVEGALLDHLDRSLLDHRAAAGNDSAPTPGRQVAPEQQRVQHRNQADKQQDDPPRALTLMPGVAASMAKARMAPSTIRKMPTPMLNFHVLQGADGEASLLVVHAPRSKVQTGRRRYERTFPACWQGPLLLCHGLGRDDPSCAAWRRTCDRFCVRSNEALAAGISEG